MELSPLFFFQVTERDKRDHWLSEVNIENLDESCDDSSNKNEEEKILRLSAIWFLRYLSN